MDIKKGLIVTARTYAEFLNKTFNTNYKGWYKSTFNYSDDIVVWIIRIDSKDRKGFKNYIEENNIIEESTDNPTRSYKPIRMVFQVLDTSNDYKNFVYMGKYKLSDNSTFEKRIFTPIEIETTL